MGGFVFLSESENVSTAISLLFLSALLWYFLQCWAPPVIQPLWSFTLFACRGMLNKELGGGGGQNNRLSREDKRRKHPEEIIKISHLTPSSFPSAITPSPSLFLYYYHLHGRNCPSQEALYLTKDKSWSTFIYNRKEQQYLIWQCLTLQYI